MAGTNRRYIRSKALEWALGEWEGGKPYVGVSFKIKDSDGAEKFVSWRGWFTEAATDRTIESLRHLGFEGDDVSNLIGLDKNEVDLVIEDEEYTNEEGETKITTRVQFINALRGPMVKTKLEGEKLGSFAAQMKAKFRAVDAAAGKRVGTKSAAAKPAAGGPMGDEPPPLGNEDIPF
ncbi:MAG: hypothetical protein Q8K32_09220 [Archangium sp.]|nr:hypothetical protein [Archangium sp.]